MRSRLVRREASGRPLALRAPLVRSSPLRTAFWDYFESRSPLVHARGRTLARSGVWSVEFRRTGPDREVHAEVLASTGDLLPVHLLWKGPKPVPSRVVSGCPCAYRRAWCKHAIAAAYHLIDRVNASSSAEAASVSPRAR